MKSRSDETRTATEVKNVQIAQSDETLHYPKQQINGPIFQFAD